MKNILFNIDQTFVYNEREIKLNKKYKDNIIYHLNVLIHKTVFDIGLKSKKNILIYSDTNSKIRLLSNLFNKNTLNLYKHGDIIFMSNKKYDLVENSIFIKNMLIYQCVKKWIYNNYNGIEMDNVIILTKLNLSDSVLQDKYILLDTNKYNNKDNYKRLLNKQIEFMSLIFTYTKNIQIHNPNYYYIIEGIKFII